jgi:hypothetical protein
MTRASTTFASLASLAALAACNPYDPDLGNTPFKCGSADPICPDGYTCTRPGDPDGVCVKGGNITPDASTVFVCADDGNLEPNDMANRAFVTPIPSSMMSYQLRGLALCPAGDNDFFQFGVVANGTNLEAQVISVNDVLKPPLQLNLLTSTGAVIATGASSAETDQLVSLSVENRLAAGTYILQVKSPTDVENNFDLVIKTCTTPLPCPDPE